MSPLSREVDLLTKAFEGRSKKKTTVGDSHFQYSPRDLLRIDPLKKQQIETESTSQTKAISTQIVQTGRFKLTNNSKSRIEHQITVPSENGGSITKNLCKEIAQSYNCKAHLKNIENPVFSVLFLIAKTFSHYIEHDIQFAISNFFNNAPPPKFLIT